MNQELTAVLKALPDGICEAVEAKRCDEINEVRIRAGRRISVTSHGENISCDYITDEKCLRECVSALCSHSYYTHGDTINNGYISLKNGFRVGVCGSAVCSDGIIRNINDITALNIRVPARIYSVGGAVFDRLSARGFCDSVLIYSPPGVGKTTMLRDLILRLSEPPCSRRVSVIDTRCEIENSDISACANVDIFRGYPKAKGIEIATRVMSPQYLVCDEIGDYEEARSLLAVQNCGVPIIATAHASSAVELLLRSNIRLLHEAAIFSLYVGLRRRNGSKMSLMFCSRDEVG